ncbi:MAG: hypothetical protein WDM89_09930 [Rhizomicrobium sp.]
MSELCAMELMARCSYEHPDLSWSNICRLPRMSATRHGTPPSSGGFWYSTDFPKQGMPQHGANYEYAYAFPECEPGSKHELIWRLLVMCTILEALAIDKLPVEIATRDAVGPADFAARARLHRR